MSDRLSPEERRYKRDFILSRVAQLLNREYMKDIATPREVAGLAIELARLKGATEAKQFADDAVELLRESAEALGRPSPGTLTPERAEAEIMAFLVRSEEESRVPFAQLVGEAGAPLAKEQFAVEIQGGKSVMFEPYSTEKGFRKLLLGYAENCYQAHAMALKELLAGKSPRKEDAVRHITRYGGEDFGADIAKVQRGFSKTALEKFVAEWATRAAKHFAADLLKTARAGFLDRGTAAALLRFRQQKTINRNRKASEARRKP